VWWPAFESFIGAGKQGRIYPMGFTNGTVLEGKDLMEFRVSGDPSDLLELQTNQTHVDSSEQINHVLKNIKFVTRGIVMCFEAAIVPELRAVWWKQARSVVGVGREESFGPWVDSTVRES
jgi:hypothetical protein